MKRTVLIVFFACSILSVSCTIYSEQQIKEQARRYNSDNPILHDIERYADYYFKVPDSLEELACFTKNFAENNEIRDMGTDDAEHIQYLFERRLKYVSDTDSCFFYDPKYKVGCCFDSLPQLKLNQPWKTGIGYGYLIHPNLYGEDDFPIFEWPDSLESVVLAKANIARYIMCATVMDSEQNLMYSFPIRIICKVTNEKILTLLIDYLPEGDYFIYDKETNMKIPCKKSDVRLSVFQKEEMIEAVERYFSDYSSLKAIIFYSLMYFN